MQLIQQQNAEGYHGLQISWVYEMAESETIEDSYQGTSSGVPECIEKEFGFSR
jgi:hypothetical protein